MQIVKLEIKNWCQHASGSYDFKPGLCGILGDNGCVDETTLIYDPVLREYRKVSDISTPFHVEAHVEGRVVVAQAGVPFIKGVEQMFQVTTSVGTITVTAKHRFLTPQGWRFLGDLVVGSDVLSCLAVRCLPTASQSVRDADDRHSTQTVPGSQASCLPDCRQDGALPQSGLGTDQATSPLQVGALPHISHCERVDDPVDGSSRNHPYPPCGHPSTNGSDPLQNEDRSAATVSGTCASIGSGSSAHSQVLHTIASELAPGFQLNHGQPTLGCLSGSVTSCTGAYEGQPVQDNQHASESQPSSSKHQDGRPRLDEKALDLPTGSESSHGQLVSCEAYEPFRVVPILSINGVGARTVWDLEVPGYHNYLAGGFVNHNSGKSNILSAIAFALTGSATSFGTKGDNLKYGTKSGWVELTFKHEGHVYVIKRAVEKASQSLTGPKVDLTKTSEIEVFLTRLLGATPAVLLNNVFATQGEIDRILYTPPSARLKEFQSTFGLMRAEQAYRALGVELQGVKLTPGLQDLVTTCTDQRKDAQESLADLETRQAELREKIQVLTPCRDVIARALAAVKQRDVLNTARDRKKSAQSDLVSAQTELARLQPAADLATRTVEGTTLQLTELRELKAGFDRATKECTQLKLDLLGFQSIPSPVVVCPTPAKVLELQQSAATAAAVLKQAVDASNGTSQRPRMPKEVAQEAELATYNGQLAALQLPENMVEARLAALSKLADLRSHQSQFDDGICPTCGAEVAGGPTQAATLQEKIAEAKEEARRHVQLATEWLTNAKSTLVGQINAVTGVLATYTDAWAAVCSKKLDTATSANHLAKAAWIAAHSATEEWAVYRVVDQKRSDLQARLDGVLMEMPGLSFDSAEITRLVAQEQAARKAVNDHQLAASRAGLAQVESDKAGIFFASIASTVDEPDPAELLLAQSQSKELAISESDLRDLTVASGAVQGKLQMLEAELTRLKLQQSTELKDAMWAEIVTKARQTLHVSELPAAVMSDYSNRLNDRIQFYLTGWGSEFSMALDVDLAFKAKFPDKEHDAARLSGGQKIVASTSFRFAMADLFAQQVGLLVLDEPSTALDASKVVHLQKLLVKLKEMAGHGDRQIIIVTHEVSLMGFLEHVIEL